MDHRKDLILTALEAWINQRPGLELAGNAWEHLSSLPVDSERNKLRDVIRQQGDKLASAAAKFLTLNAEYAERRTWKRKLELERLPVVYPKGYGDSPEAKRYHMRRVAEYRAASICRENRTKEAA